MNFSSKIAAVAFVGFVAAGTVPAAFADEVSTTTTHSTTVDDGPAVVVEHSHGIVTDDAHGCSKEKVTKTDDVTGDRVSKSRTTCD